MKKNIFLLAVILFVLLISACGVSDDEGIFAGAECTFEGSEICSDNGVDILVCQSSTWTLKKQCNISIGKRCRPGADGNLGCFGDGESGGSGNGGSGTADNSDTESTDASDSDSSSDTEGSDTASENPDNEQQTDTGADTQPDNPDTSENPDTDSGDTGETPDTDTDTDSADTSETPDIDNDTDSGDSGETPDTDTDTDSSDTGNTEGSCNSNSDCSGATPHCSLSTSKCIANAVFITEYVEGSGDNKAIEIYNGSKSSVSLSNYTLQQANNGKSWGSDANYVFNFAAATATSISSGQIFVFCNANSDTELVAKCDKSLTSAVFQFNGNDAIALFNGTSIVDQIGIQGDTVAWSVAGTTKATENHTLRRKTSVIQGTTDWSASAGTSETDSQWIVLDQDTFDGLGTR